MKIRKFILKGYGEFCLAKDGGAKIEELTFPGSMITKADNRRRPGSSFNTVVKLIFAQNRNGKAIRAIYGLSSSDVISLPEGPNKELLEKLENDGYINAGDYKRHHKLDLYTPKMMQACIRWKTNYLGYEIEEDTEVVPDYAEIPVFALSHITGKNVKQFLDYSDDSIGGLTHEDLLHASTIESGLRSDFDLGKNLKRRYAGNSVIECLPAIGRYWVRLYYKLCRATREDRLQVLGDGLDNIKEYLNKLENDK